MNRRKFVIGMGALVAGTSAAVGSGAFSSVTAERDASIEVTSDSSAYLQISAADNHLDDGNNVYASETSSGTLEITIEDLNPDATTVIDDVFTVENQGSQPVGVQATVNDDGSDDDSDDSDSVTLNPGDDSADLQDNWATLGVGDSVMVSLEIDTNGLSAGDTVATSITFEADANEADTSGA